MRVAETWARFRSDITHPRDKDFLWLVNCQNQKRGRDSGRWLVISWQLLNFSTMASLPLFFSLPPLVATVPRACPRLCSSMLQHDIDITPTGNDKNRFVSWTAPILFSSSRRLLSERTVIQRLRNAATLNYPEEPSPAFINTSLQTVRWASIVPRKIDSRSATSWKLGI